ncbi:MAG: mannitol dehydrogenase [Oscillospiraceae bacterium]|nr:mannitol dehydrogenase [Oscillospiraceae bacterium]MDD4413342.1 mannitol dehydrogenase [Oscillospiraceae bacterium]
MGNTFLQYGAGNIGRGFLGQVFGQAGYKVEFVDVNTDIINAFNKDKKYPVNIVTRKNPHEIWIENVCCIDGMDEQAVAAAISRADIMAVSVGVNILKHIVPNLVNGFKMRWADNNMRPLDIIVAENLLHADKMLRDLITKKLSQNEKILFDQKIGLVESSIGRMVPVMTKDMSRGNILRICVENYCELPVDKDAFKGDIPQIKHLHPFSPFEFYIKRKLYIHNMGHALTAYLGFVYGYEYVWQAVENPYIKLIVQRAMTEAAVSLSRMFSVPLDGLLEHIYDLLLRFANRELGDTVSRVGRDVFRKLAPSDRFIGAINMCVNQSDEPLYIPVGVAAALFSAHSDDADINIDTVLSGTCGIERNAPVYSLIKDYYTLLIDGVKLEKLVSEIEDRLQQSFNRKTII